MAPAVIVAMASAALEFLGKAIPQIRQWAKDGEVSAEDQQKIQTRYNALKAGAGFDGPEWQKSGRTE